VNFLLVDLNRGGGHHAHYVAAVATQARARGWRVRLATTGDAIRDPSHAVVRSVISARDIITVSPVRCALGGRIGLLERSFRVWDTARRAAATGMMAFPADAIFLPECDNLVWACALLGSPFGPTPWCSVSMKMEFAHRRQGLHGRNRPRFDRLQEWVFKESLAKCQRFVVTTVDEVLVRYFGHRYPPLKDRLLLLPEIAHPPARIDRGEARRLLGLPADVFLVVCYGAITMRKGLREFISALARIPACTRTTGLVAGTLDDTARHFLEQPEVGELQQTGRLKVMPGYVDSDCLGLLVSAADMCWVGYPHFYGSSGVLWEAVLAGVPVLATNTGLIGYWTRKYGMGRAVDVSCAQEVADLMVSLRDDPAQVDNMKAGCRTAVSERMPGFAPFGVSVCDAICAAVATDPTLSATVPR